ncbi:MAG: SWIM zinc finger family protein [Trichodesmium sp. St7_bin2_1]|nr:SWIM zinc finger family protein [Trichodesmium sp. St7_bin2_1]
MANFSKTWWGKLFIEGLESFTDLNRLGRGRSYARNGKIKDYKINNGKITAKVKGSINPYFGVYKEPLYNTTIEIKPIKEADWSKAIAYLGSKASFISKLLLGEMPDNIDSAFADLNLHLLPHSHKDFKTNCSCPDWQNPCKHIAGVYYLVAAELDKDPFLLFELRGISRDKLQQELAKSPLGKALFSSLETEEILPELVDSYYTKPEKVAVEKICSAKDFWFSQKRLPQVEEGFGSTSLPAIVVKKGGDFPPFWQKESSFLAVMEELYERVRTRNKGVF